MITALEVTDWKWPNHTYILSDSMDKCLGYIRAKDGVKTMFIKPIDFSIRGRKFKKIKIEEELKYDKKVVGSKGDIYYIIDGRCTCTGFKYRGTCKHI